MNNPHVDARRAWRTASTVLAGLCLIGWQSAAAVAAPTKVTHSTLNAGGCCADHVAWSPDGTLLAVAGGSALRLFRGTGQQAATIVQVPSPVRSVAWSSDGTLLATGSQDGLVRIYTSAGRSVTSYGRRGAAVNAVTWSKDGTGLLAAASADGAVRIFQKNAELLTTLRADYDVPVLAVSWSKLQTMNGGLVAYATSDGVWVETVGEHMVAMLDHGAGVTSLAWSPDGQLLATGLNNGTVHVWGATGILLNTLRGLSSRITSVAWSPNGTRIAAGTIGHAVQVWTAIGQPLARLSGPTAAVQDLAWSADSKSLVAASGEAVAQVWQIDS